MPLECKHRQVHEHAEGQRPFLFPALATARTRTIAALARAASAAFAAAAVAQPSTIAAAATAPS